MVLAALSVSGCKSEVRPGRRALALQELPGVHRATKQGALVHNTWAIAKIRSLLSEEFVCYGYQKDTMQLKHLVYIVNNKKVIPSDGRLKPTGNTGTEAYHGSTHYKIPHQAWAEYQIQMTNLTSSEEAETGNAGEQPVRNILMNGDHQMEGAGKHTPSTLKITLFQKASKNSLNCYQNNLNSFEKSVQTIWGLRHK